MVTNSKYVIKNGRSVAESNKVGIRSHFPFSIPECVTSVLKKKQIMMIYGLKPQQKSIWAICPKKERTKNDVITHRKQFHKEIQNIYPHRLSSHTAYYKQTGGEFTRNNPFIAFHSILIFTQIPFQTVSQPEIPGYG